METYILRFKFYCKFGFLDITQEEFTEMFSSAFSHGTAVNPRPHRNSDEVKNRVIEELIKGNAHFEDLFPIVELQNELEIQEPVSYVDISLELESFPFIEDFELHKFRLYKKALTVLNNPSCKLNDQDAIGEGEIFSFGIENKSTEKKHPVDNFADSLKIDKFTIVTTGKFRIFESKDSAEATEKILNSLLAPQAYLESKSKHIGFPTQEDLIFPLAQSEHPVYIIELYALENSFVGRGIPIFSENIYLGRTHSIPTLQRIFRTLKESEGLQIYSMEISEGQGPPHNFIKAMYMDAPSVEYDIPL